MAIFKCKMCGGALEINNNETVAVCEYCNTKQTLPKLDDDRKANLYDRANHFRRNNEFDKAMGIYEQILNDDNTDAESYWSLVLCRYGVEYVEDPQTHKRIPTVNRAQYTSVFADEDYKSAIQYADSFQKEIYEAEAKAIDEIQKGILEISQKEEPFDVFICYKETDANGRRTPDSVLATELYHELTRDGFKVFFSRITLEDKLGTAYEPYIFAALNSAKVMVVLGTKPEHFNAVWVKNEWSRYLSLVKNSNGKKILIPAYKDMDPYDLPEEFSHLQAQDMSKLGFMQDLIRGIKKLTEVDTPKPTVIKETVVTGGNANIAPLLERVFMFLEDGEWASADEYCEKVLDIDPKCAEAYVGKLLVSLKVRSIKGLKYHDVPFDRNNNYQKVLRFADDTLKNELEGYIAFIKERNLNIAYTNATEMMNSAKTEKEFKNAAARFEKINEYKDSASQAEICLEKAEEARLEAERIAEKNRLSKQYDAAISKMVSATTEEDYKKAAEKFDEIKEYSDSASKAKLCLEKAEEAKAEAKHIAEVRRIADEKAAVEAAARAKKVKKLAALVMSIVAVILAVVLVLTTVIIPNSKYNNAVELMNNGEYKKAFAIFSEITSYKDTKEQIKSIVPKITLRETVSAGNASVVAVKSDGTVVAAGTNASGKGNVEHWSDIIAVSSGGNHSVGLKSDGTVVAVGNNDKGQCDVSNWKNIVAISAGTWHTVGLKSDGTVIAVGNNDEGQCDVSNWKNIVAISAGTWRTVGLKSDGTVVAAGTNASGKGFVAVSEGWQYTVGLTSDGTVFAAGNNDEGQCNVSDWKNIVAISAGYDHTVGLKSDGTVVAVGNNDEGQCNVSDWKDIVAISAGDEHTVGLKSDGTVVAVGSDTWGQCDVDNFTNIKIPE